MLRPKIMDRWFPADEAADETSEIERRAELAGEDRTFIKSPAYARLRAWIEDTLNGFEVKPGPHDEMLHHAGVREGLRLVKDRLDRVEALVREDDARSRIEG